MRKVNVALVGLGFGAAFLDIYREHPGVGTVGVFDISEEVMSRISSTRPDVRLYTSYEEILSDPQVDAIHLVTPIPLHAQQTVQALRAGKHCACTVPMATTLEDLQLICNTVRETDKKYMLMETTLYTYQYFYVKGMLERGELGRIQFMRGSHYQDMLDWPEYWMGLPPMHYGTHAIAPMVGLSGSRIQRVHCFGSGSMAEDLVEKYGNPFPVECAIFDFENGMKGEATRSLFETARAYQEGMFIYGSKASFEWGFRDGDNPYITTLLPLEPGRRGADCVVTQVELPNPYHSLPEGIQHHTVGDLFDPLNPHEALEKGAGGGHHGSHPHLVHEFVSSILEDRRPWIDEHMGANITGAGICAHLSAMKNGEAVEVPRF